MGTSPNTKPESLTELRARIDAIDDEIIALLIKRIELSNFIMKSKPAAQVVDPKREQEIVGRYSGMLFDVSTPAKSQRIALAVIATSGIYPENGD